MIKAGIIGDGYTAAELIRILAGHDEVEVVSVLSTENVGRRMDQVFPHLTGFCSLECEESLPEKLIGRCQLVFLALPHGLSVNIALTLLKNGIKCVDLGADFRLKDASLYREYYELEHQAPQMLEQAVYGLPEIYRDKIRNADLAANPGCFPTGAILPLVPLLKEGIIKPEGMVIDAKTGVSGAGRTAKFASHFCEVNEGIKAYGVGTHRHGPEIRQELSFAAGMMVDMIFTPHLVPMNRGILSTCYAQLAAHVSPDSVREALEDWYGKEYFIRILPPGTMPHTKWVYGSNFLDIGVYTDPRSGRVVLISALDNLTKGASGQAVQNMNLMLGIDEKKALMFAGVHP